MELTEAVQRIVWHHLVLILALMGLGMAVPLALEQRRDPSYEATSRVILSDDAADADQVKSLADTATAIVTAPSTVQAALDASKVDRDARDVARKHVTVRPIGDSGVLAVSVTDGDRRAASAIANGLADQLVKIQNEATRGSAESELAKIDADYEKASAELEGLKELVDGPRGGDDDLARLLIASATQQRTDLSRARSTIVVAMPPAPKVIDPAGIPTKPVPSGIKARTAVGGLLGLALGLAAAAVLETLRPTIANPDGLARALGTPILGQLPKAPQQAQALEDPSIPTYIRLAAAGADVTSVQLVRLGPPVDLPRLARWLQKSVGAFPDIEAIDLPPAVDSLSTTAAVDLRDPGVAIGVVVVAPTVLPRSDLRAIEALVAMTQWPLLGVITYRRRRFATDVPADDPPAPAVRRSVSAPSRHTASAS